LNKLNFFILFAAAFAPPEGGGVEPVGGAGLAGDLVVSGGVVPVLLDSATGSLNAGPFVVLSEESFVG
jgi:hypothetical protein